MASFQLCFFTIAHLPVITFCTFLKYSFIILHVYFHISPIIHVSTLDYIKSENIIIFNIKLSLLFAYHQNVISEFLYICLQTFSIFCNISHTHFLFFKFLQTLMMSLEHLSCVKKFYAP